VIEGGEFTHVGETEDRRSDVRFLAATNRDLSKMVEDGRFREDLYFCLKVVPIHLPPLREKGENRELGMAPSRRLTEGNILAIHTYPGDIKLP
jgi:transcriptional regulator with GAF, ATPase, and Fis domain